MPAELRETAREVLRDLLYVYGLDDEARDYEIIPEEMPGEILLNIRSSHRFMPVLVGVEGNALPHLQRVFFGALGVRYGRVEGVKVWLAVNGRRPDMRRLSAFDNGNAGPKVVLLEVKAIAPPGVEVRTQFTQMSQ